MAAASRATIRRASTLPALPGDLAGAVCTGALPKEASVNAESLASWLAERGVDTSGWNNAGNAKSVEKLWKEIHLGEAGVEVWEIKNATKVLRSTHVLRGKVCSPSSLKRGVFLFNTWQQFADGRKRIRNGLLSEKLSTSEIPLDKHLLPVCKRAVEEEEMQRLVDAPFVIGKSTPAPEFDPEYKCPLEVVDANFIDYTIEVEESKSFPGLLTAYHLYTVDIVCHGLPTVDFNTLEFEHPNESGTQMLKYIHAWNWLRWPQIQRYLFEGSSLKESKQKGAFSNVTALEDWLNKLGIETGGWGQDGKKSVSQLLREVNNEEAQLELWGRHDGAPLLMRVVHVLQVQAVASDPRLVNKFLLQSFTQTNDGKVRSVNRLMSKKLSCSEVPYNESTFQQVARGVIRNQLKHLADVNYMLQPDKMPDPADVQEGDVDVVSARLLGMHHDIQESPSFPGMLTMYHLYTLETECSGLPLTDFTSIDFGKSGGPCAYGWKWRNLPESLDILHSRSQNFERQETKLRFALSEQTTSVEKAAGELQKQISRINLISSPSVSSTSIPANGEADPLAEDTVQIARKDLDYLLARMEMMASELESSGQYATQVLEDNGPAMSLAEGLPPSMLSKMSSATIVNKDDFEVAMAQRQSEYDKTRCIRTTNQSQQ